MNISNSNNNIIIDSFLQKKRFPHAIMIEGSDGESVTNQINFIVQFVMCDSKDERPCNKCKNCMKTLSFVHPDVQVVKTSGTSNSFSVDTIRNIRQSAYVLPNEASYKVYVLNGADSMTTSAQNALLKILEEPPNHTIFILGVESSLSLLETIRSRVSIYTVSQDTIHTSDSTVIELVNKVLDSVLSSKEYDVVCLESEMIKNKQLFKDVVIGLIDEMRKAYRSAVGLDTHSLTSKTLTVEQIIKIIDELNQTLNLISRNVNQTLIVTNLFCKIRMIIFS